MTVKSIKENYKNYRLTSGRNSFTTFDFGDDIGKAVVIVNVYNIGGTVYRDVLQVVRVSDGKEMLSADRCRPCDSLADAVDVACEMIASEKKEAKKANNNAVAKFNKKGNMKLGVAMWSFSKLYGDMKHFSKKYGYVIGSCGGHCEGCKGSCYVKKSYRYPSVIDGHARNTLAIRNDIEKAFTDLNDQIDRAKNKPAYIRIDQSGEIESPIELLMWVLSAKKHPNIKYYTYTKNFDAVRMVINTFENGATMPENITINISIWHEYGMKEFNEFKQYKFIKAFAYDDGYDYAAAGLKIDTYCMAYGQDGKMNHQITCERCRKCIDGKCKVIGCFDH